MAINRARLCTKHKPRVYQHQCRECKKEEFELRWEAERKSKEENKDAKTDDLSVATKG